MARAVDAPFVLLVESGPDSGHERALLFQEPEALISCREPGAVRGCLEQLERATSMGRYVAGFLAYEAGYALHPQLRALSAPSPGEHLLWFGVFRAPRELSGAELEGWLGARTGGERASVSELRFDRGAAEHARDFAVIQQHLRAGDSYQVCQSLRARFDVRGSAPALFQRLRRAQPTAYSALIHSGGYHILSLSPELFFRKTGARIELEPMKGTAAAGRDAAEDAAIAERMRRDPKTRAENVMIVDLLRNDVGRLARPGRVEVPELFAVKRFAKVLQMTSSIRAELEPGVGLASLMEALFPSGSVTGAPKLRTMQIIRALEPSARGIFCGSIGYVSPEADACFNVAIRSLFIDAERRGVLGVGSGVVVDSSADAEYAECLLKARFLSDAAE